MTPVATAGGPVDLAPADSDVRVVRAKGIVALRLHYGVSPLGSSDTYRVAFAPVRLTASISETDEGFVAKSPELGSLGYGPDPESALLDLQDSVRDYLTVLAEKQPPLAPEIVHHGRYVQLLEQPATSWFAAVNGPPAPAPDAT